MKLTKSLFLPAVVAISMAMASCTSTEATSTSTSSTAAAVESTGATNYNGQIVYVRMDSLMNSYGLYIDLGAEFSKKQQQVQKELESKSRSLENQVKDYQEKAQKGLITTYQARSTEESLQKKQQEILAYRDKIMNDLAQEEAVISSKITEAVMSYIKEYNAEKKYSMIIQTMGGTPVLLADPSLDITKEILDELNKRYESTIPAVK